MMINELSYFFCFKEQRRFWRFREVGRFLIGQYGFGFVFGRSYSFSAVLMFEQFLFFFDHLLVPEFDFFFLLDTNPVTFLFIFPFSRYLFHQFFPILNFFLSKCFHLLPFDNIFFFFHLVLESIFLQFLSKVLCLFFTVVLLFQDFNCLKLFCC